MASTAAWVRSDAPSFSSARCRYFFTVPTLQLSRAPISRFVRPWAPSRSICSSAVSGSPCRTSIAGCAPYACSASVGPEQRGVEHRLAVAHRLERRQELAAADALQHVAGGAALDRATDERRIVVHGDDEDGHLPLRGFEPPQHGEPVDVGQLHVEQDHLRLAQRGGSDGFLAGRGLADHVDVRTVQHAPQSLADHRMVVHDQDADGRWIRTRVRGHGRAAAGRGRGCRRRRRARRHTCPRGAARAPAC